MGIAAASLRAGASGSIDRDLLRRVRPSAHASPAMTSRSDSAARPCSSMRQGSSPARPCARQLLRNGVASWRSTSMAASCAHGCSPLDSARGARVDRDISSTAAIAPPPGRGAYPSTKEGADRADATERHRVGPPGSARQRHLSGQVGRRDAVARCCAHLRPIGPDPAAAIRDGGRGRRSCHVLVPRVRVVSDRCSHRRLWGPSRSAPTRRSQIGLPDDRPQPAATRTERCQPSWTGTIAQRPAHGSVDVDVASGAALS